MAGGHQGRFNAPAELPNGFHQLFVGSVPQPAAVKIGTPFTNRRQQLAGPHLRNDLGQRLKGGKQIRSGFVGVHSRSLTRGESAV